MKPYRTRGSSFREHTFIKGGGGRRLRGEKAFCEKAGGEGRHKTAGAHDDAFGDDDGYHYGASVSNIFLEKRGERYEKFKKFYEGRRRNGNG